MKIEICENCQGEGKLSHVWDVRSREYEEVKCNDCNGTGRVLTKTYSLVMPYSQDISEFYKRDTKVVNLINSFKKRKQ